MFPVVPTVLQPAIRTPAIAAAVILGMSAQFLMSTETSNAALGCPPGQRNDRVGYGATTAIGLVAMRQPMTGSWSAV